MTRAFERTLLAAAVVIATAAPAAAQGSPVPLLDVPYVLQSEELCGGAAAAMVMRFWGATGVYAESFSHLVDKRLRGITGEALLGALRERGWVASSFRGDPDSIRHALLERRPPVTLIEVRPQRYHYVVVLGWASGKVIVHDPARAPFTVHDEDAFLRAWSRSGFWTMAARPGGALPASTEAAAAADSIEPPAVASACGELVEDGIRLANGGDLAAAAGVLERATAQCPSDASAWRERAGLRALEKDWRRAAADARHALTLAPEDEHAARILGTSLFLDGATPAALAAWNRIGEPTVDLVEVRGLERTRYVVAHQALGLAPQSLLTPDRLVRAARRLDAIPAAMGTRVSYTPLDGGLARVTGALIERPLFPATILAATPIALRAVTDRELRVTLANVTRGGELWSAGWRWWEARPRVDVGLEAPVPLLGTIALTAFHERQRYAEGSGQFDEQRRSVSLTASDWVTGTLRWRAHVSREQWPGRAATGSGAGLTYRSPDERLTLEGHAAAWAAGDAVWTTSASAEWRSRTRHDGMVWLARAGGDLVSHDAPLALWAGAGTGQARPALLRAHPLLDDGVVADAVFGRRLFSAGAEGRRWGGPVKRVFRIAPAVFVDMARAAGGTSFTDGRMHVDAGAGVRLAIPGAGVLRADVARGLRDGRMALSFGWIR